MLKKYLTFIAATFITVATSVAADEVKVNGRDYIERDAPTGMNTVKFIDFSLQRTKEKKRRWSKKTTTKKYIRIGVESEGIRMNRIGNPEVWTLLRNFTDYDYYLEARVQFFDAQQIPSEPQSAWRKISIPKNAIGTYKEFGTNPDSVYYVVEVREVR